MQAMLVDCTISISRYPAQPQFVHKYGISITRKGVSDVKVTDLDTDEQLTRLLEDVVGNTHERAVEIIEILKEDPQISYQESIEDVALSHHGF